MQPHENHCKINHTNTFPWHFPVLEFDIRRVTRICAEGALSRDTVKVWIGVLGVLSIEGSGDGTSLLLRLLWSEAYVPLEISFLGRWHSISYMIAISSRIRSCSIAGTGRFSSLLLGLLNYIQSCPMYSRFAHSLNFSWGLVNPCYFIQNGNCLLETPLSLSQGFGQLSGVSGSANSNPPLITAERPAKKQSIPSGMFLVAESSGGFRRFRHNSTVMTVCVQYLYLPGSRVFANLVSHKTSVRADFGLQKCREVTHQKLWSRWSLACHAWEHLVLKRPDSHNKRLW